MAQAVSAARKIENKVSNQVVKRGKRKKESISPQIDNMVFGTLWAITHLPLVMSVLCIATSVMNHHPVYASINRQSVGQSDGP